ncbi:MAG: hypothetical protein A2V66_06840 [Ignavibacteria bacterium RBG_13_36_8]|nr:MAG: hypothetical protein A2V66_06840 [Ignavibacteria bacterium RBG_13_36_8]
MNGEFTDTLTLFLILILLIVFVAVFLALALKIRRTGGSLTTIVYGATDEFYTADKKRAIEVVAETKAGKKMEEQSSKEPANRNNYV